MMSNTPVAQKSGDTTKPLYKFPWESCFQNVCWFCSQNTTNTNVSIILRTVSAQLVHLKEDIANKRPHINKTNALSPRQYTKSMKTMAKIIISNCFHDICQIWVSVTLQQHLHDTRRRNYSNFRLLILSDRRLQWPEISRNFCLTFFIKSPFSLNDTPNQKLCIVYDAILINAINDIC